MLIEDENISSSILPFKKDVPLARGTSFLKGKIDEEIFSSSINIYDKPDIVKGLGPIL